MKKKKQEGFDWKLIIMGVVVYLVLSILIKLDANVFDDINCSESPHVIECYLLSVVCDYGPIFIFWAFVWWIAWRYEMGQKFRSD